MSARQVASTIAHRRLVAPKTQKSYVKWYMNWADKVHKAVVLTCVGVTLYYGVGVVYMFIQSRKNKGELRRKLIEAGVIDEDGRQLLHRLQGEDSWLGEKGIEKRETLQKRIEEKAMAAESAAEKARFDKLALEEVNTDRTRLGIFDPDAAVIEANRKRKEDMEKPDDEGTVDPRVGVFYQDREKRSASWFGWLNWKTGEAKQVEAQQSKEAKS